MRVVNVVLSIGIACESPSLLGVHANQLTDVEAVSLGAGTGIKLVEILDFGCIGGGCDAGNSVQLGVS